MDSKPKVRLAWVKIVDIKIPDVRITSVWEPEALAMFKDSIKAMGIVDKPIIVEEKENLWLVDGLHRMQEAQLNGETKLHCVITEGRLQDVYLKNLMMNKLRGKTKISEMVMVIKKLETDFKMDMDAIHKETGLKRDYIEKMMVVGKVRREVLQDLDDERIAVGHAYELGRVEDPDVQMRLLVQTEQFHIKVDDLHDIVDKTLEILKQRAAAPTSTGVPDALPMSTVKCGFCREDRLVDEVKMFPLCHVCFPIAYEAVQKAKAARAPAPAPQVKVQD